MKILKLHKLLLFTLPANSTLSAASLVRRAARAAFSREYITAAAREHPVLAACAGIVVTGAVSYAGNRGYKKFAMYQNKIKIKRAADAREARKKIFLLACKVGDAIKVKELLQQQENALTDGYAHEGITEAARSGKSLVIRELLTAGVKTNEQDINQLKRAADAWKAVNEAGDALASTPLPDTAQELERVFTQQLWRLLRAADTRNLPDNMRFVNFSKNNLHGQNALTQAACYGRFELVKELMAAGAPLAAEQIERLHNKDEAWLELEKIIHAELWQAVAKNDRTAVQHILKKPRVHANIQKMIKDDFSDRRIPTTPLMEALKNNSFELAQDLIYADAQVDVAAVNKLPNKIQVWKIINEAYARIKQTTLDGIDNARAQALKKEAAFPTAVNDLIGSYMFQEQTKT